MVKVLMFGWEFPPHNSGGLGIACQGLTKGLSRAGADVIFVLPKKVNVNEELIKFVYGDDLKAARTTQYVINSPLKPYVTTESYVNETFHDNLPNIYGNTLLEEVVRYGEVAKIIAEQETFDVIHAHDWLTMKAGIAAKEVSKKPLVVHIHATEFDRTAGNNNQLIYDIEREGMHKADLVVTVSNWTKDKVVEHYGISPDKVRVVHNAVDFENNTIEEVYRMKKDEDKKVVLFVGRITIQKGPDYFLAAAKRVTSVNPNVVFVFAGSGDMERSMIEKAAHLGIADKVLFAGFLRGNDLLEAFKMADVFVMPSVSEPFGLVPLESMSCGTPAIISKQSGVSEIVTHCLKVDFWDVDETANKILALLNYPVLHRELVHNGRREVQTITWNKPAQECINIYNEVLSH